MNRFIGTITRELHQTRDSMMNDETVKNPFFLPADMKMLIQIKIKRECYQ